MTVDNCIARVVHGRFLEQARDAGRQSFTEPGDIVFQMIVSLIYLRCIRITQFCNATCLGRGRLQINGVTAHFSFFHLLATMTRARERVELVYGRRRGSTVNVTAISNYRNYRAKMSQRSLTRAHRLNQNCVNQNHDHTSRVHNSAEF